MIISFILIKKKLHTNNFPNRCLLLMRSLSLFITNRHESLLNHYKAKRLLGTNGFIKRKD